MSCADLGKATIVGVWAKAETTCGTFVMPAATDVILPTGYPAVNQEFPTTDGMEISNSLDITEEFQAAAQPVSFTIPMYTRVPAAASLGTAIQGDVLFQSLLGGESHTADADVLAGDWTIGGDELGFDTLTLGWFPDMGVILCGTEQIFYRGIEWTSATAGTFLNCERGYNGTTAATHSADDQILLKSRFFKQDNDSPPFSTVVQLDHTTFYITGCAANSATVGITNEGGMGWSFDCQALSFEWAGKCTLVAASAASGQADVVVPDAKLFSAGAYVQNTTLDKDNGGAGYKILSIDYGTNTLTLNANLDANWVATNVVEGFTPGSTSLAYTIENRYTDVYVDDTATTVQNTDLSISCPKQFITDEVGSTYPTAFVEDKRSITGTFSLYARAADAKYIYENTQRTEVKMHILFGETEGRRMGISLRRTKLTNPTISGNGPTMNMSLNLKALGKIDSTTSEVGENSLELVTM